MSDDGRIIRLETEMGHVRAEIQGLKGSVEDVRTELHAFRADVAKEFGSVRTEMAKELGSVRADMERQSGSLRAEMEKQSGALRTEMATQLGTLKTSMERYMRLTITAGLGIVATLITMFATVVHALKWF